MGTIAVKPPSAYFDKNSNDANRRFHNPNANNDDLTPDEIENRRVWDPDTDAALGNTVKKAYVEDLLMVDAQQSARMPSFIKRELEKTSYKEACRKCFELEKVMGACLQTKLWTAWKCEKERDRYFACIESFDKSPEALNDLRWKYNLGVYHGEIVARRRLMHHLWSEYFPDRSMEHAWAEE